MPGGSKTQPKPQIDFDKFVELKPAWQVEFKHGITRATFRRSMTKLIDIGKSDDPNLHTFAGTITYRCDFDVNDAAYRILDLGKVLGISEAALNGRTLGVRWYGRHVYDMADALKPGKNTLEVKVTTHLGNYTHSLKDNPVAKSWTRQMWVPFEPMGMTGPVRLLKIVDNGAKSSGNTKGEQK